ncbi:MAG: hypothetical protein IPK04_17890 [Bdellovibrionales bacterium]|nr:hypothetical protein [Bdellovibrionales bacterium]
MSKPTSFLLLKSQRFFGGCLCAVIQKKAFQLRALHIVLKSEWAIGPSSLAQHADFVDRTIRAWAKNGVKIYELVNGQPFASGVMIVLPSIEFIRTIQH